MFILNDIHLGTSRKAGATPTSSAELKAYLQSEFRRLVNQCHGHLCLLGDIFDGFAVDPGEVIQAYETLADYIHGGGYKVTLVKGNHDHANNSAKTSSFHLLAHILKSRFPDNVEVVDEGLTMIQGGDIWAIPHVANQSLFDLEIEKAIDDQDVMYLLLHCNINSPFAEHSDHSLNLSGDLYDRLCKSGIRVVCAHEHAGRTLNHGRIHVIGNQIPSSVSDCINDLNEVKVFVEINDDGIIEHEACRIKDLYAKLEWNNLDDVDTNLKFIRVGGFATAAEAPAALAAIAKLRQNHNAFVITNAVQIEGMSSDIEVASLESVKSFNVLEALLDILSPEESKVVKELLEC